MSNEVTSIHTLSELDTFLHNTPDQSKNSFYGLVVDKWHPLDATYSGLKELSFVAQPDPVTQSTVDFGLLEVLASFRTHFPQCNLLLELPSESRLELASLLRDCMSLSVELLCQPPKYDDNPSVFAKLWEDYTDQQLKLWKLAIEFNIAINIYPISGYFRYLVEESYGVTRDALTDDELLYNNFVKGNATAEVNKFKTTIRDAIETYLAEVLNTSPDKAIKAFVATVFESTKQNLAAAIKNNDPKLSAKPNQEETK